MLSSFLTSVGSGVKVYLDGACDLPTLIAFFHVLVYAYWPLYYVAVTSAYSLALQHTVWLAHNLLLNLV